MRLHTLFVIFISSIVSCMYLQWHVINWRYGTPWSKLAVLQLRVWVLVIHWASSYPHKSHPGHVGWCGSVPQVHPTVLVTCLCWTILLIHQNPSEIHQKVGLLKKKGQFIIRIFFRIFDDDDDVDDDDDDDMIRMTISLEWLQWSDPSDPRLWTSWGEATGSVACITGLKCWVSRCSTTV